MMTPELAKWKIVTALNNLKMSSQGFTFIELLVTIAISGLLLGMGVAAYNNFSDHQKLLMAVRSLKTNLRAAQSKAMANKIPILEDPEDECDPFEGYQVTIKKDEYQIVAMCNGDEVGETEVEYMLPSKIERVIIGEENLVVLFKPLTSGVELPDEAGEEGLVLTYEREDTEDNDSITITPAGEIK